MLLYFWLIYLNHVTNLIEFLKFFVKFLVVEKPQKALDFRTLNF
jgi:hypothetical protein